jgi:hypothetical protein
MRRAVGTDEIPVSIGDEGSVLRGNDEILPYLAQLRERGDAPRNRLKAWQHVPQFEEPQ